MPGLADLSLADAASAIREGTITPVDLAEACLSRIEEVEPTVRAFAALDVDRTRRDAAALTEELEQGGPRGALHGIPIGVKDVIDVGGMPTRAGSHVLDDEPIPGDAPVIQRLREAGAIIVGKTTTHEFACGVTTPPTRNPWDVARIPGGSSGGSGAALSAGACIGALGTDSGGSVRIPAAFCGVSGLRPRRRTVPMDGIIPFSWTHDTCGPLGRTANDLAHLWRVMSGDQGVRTDLPMAGIKLGVLDPLQSILEVQPDVEEATYAVADALVDAGAERHDVSLPPFKEWDASRAMVVASDMFAAHREAGWYPQRIDRYSDDAVAFLQRGEAVTGGDLALARHKLDDLGARYLALFDEVDVVLVPTAIFTAPTVDYAFGATETGAPPPLVPDVMRATGPVGWCGLVSVSVPSGFAADGMPVSIQFVARDESTALSAAAAFQDATDFHAARPAMEDIASG